MGKAEFDDIYNQPDPRAYFQTLGALGYVVPGHGAPVFRRLIPELTRGGRAPVVLDVCCSYGVNAALMNHDVTLGELNQRYRSPQLATLSTDELVAADRAFFAERHRPQRADIIGLDVAERAVAYAIGVGLLSSGVAADLESGDPLAPEVEAQLASVDLIIVTGGIGYVTERTFDQVLDAAGDDPPWLAALVLRWVDFEPIAQAFERRGLVVEHRRDFVVPQRRFVDEEEREYVHHELARLDRRPCALEQDGHHAAELYLARSPADVRDRPTDRILAGLTTYALQPGA